jgi:hypothetical protein
MDPSEHHEKLEFISQDLNYLTEIPGGWQMEVQLW